MSLVTAVRAQNIRTHEDYSLLISPNITLITGVNGSGKTSLIEALYIGLQGTSFKGGDNDVLSQGSPWYRIDVKFEDESERVVKFDPSRSSGRKQFIIDGKTQYRMSTRHKYPVVLFEPEDLRLLNGSPTRRRQFIDRFISQLDPRYMLSLRRYERALKQRNALLKQNATSDSMFAWEVALSEYGAYIIRQRLYFIQKLNEELNTIYETIAHTEDSVSVHYSEDVHNNLEQKLLIELHAHNRKDSILGFTSVGPHRHDILFRFNGSSALSVASRGEVRSIILALKFLEVGIIETTTNKMPVILLDDVFSELDAYRQDHLLTSMKEHQVIITSATNNSKLKTKFVTQL